MIDKNKITALLVDDDKEEYYLVKEYGFDFSLLELDLNWVSGYDEAIERVKETCYEVFLLDYRLGGKSGIDLMNDLKRIQLDQSSVYILLTGFESSELDQRALEMGVDAFLSKDELTGKILERTIRYALERRRNFIELTKSRNQYKQIYLNTRNPVIEIDLDYNVLKVNRAVETTFKYEQFVNAITTPIKIWELLSCEEQQDALKHHISHQRANTAEVFVCRTRNLDIIEVQLNVYELLGADNTRSYQIVINDLTAKLEKDREENQKQRLDLMEKMARMVAHEVRNPLTSIILANEQLEPTLEKDKQMYTDIIRRNAVRIEGLMGKFLTTFKTSYVEQVKGNLASIIKVCIANYQDKARLMKVGLATAENNRIPDFYFDHEKLIFALSNLINNGIQACEEVPDGKVMVCYGSNDTDAYVQIVDNGCGIVTEDLPHLFEPFFSKRSGGLGLGLTTSLNIAKSHGGDILVKQNEQRGATFTFTVPLRTTPGQ